MSLDFFDLIDDYNPIADRSSLTYNELQLFIEPSFVGHTISEHAMIKLVIENNVSEDNAEQKVVSNFIPIVDDKLYGIFTTEYPSDIIPVKNLDTYNGYYNEPMPLSVYIEKPTPALRLNHESGVKTRTLYSGTISDIAGIYAWPVKPILINESEINVINEFYKYINSNNIKVRSYDIPHYNRQIFIDDIHSIISTEPLSIDRKYFTQLYRYNLQNILDTDANRALSIFRSYDNGNDLFTNYVHNISTSISDVILVPVQLALDRKHNETKYIGKSYMDKLIRIYEKIYGKKRTSNLLQKYNESDRLLIDIMTKKEYKNIENMLKIIERKINANKLLDQTIKKLRNYAYRKGSTVNQRITAFKDIWKRAKQLGKIKLDENHQYVYIPKNNITVESNDVNDVDTGNNQIIFACEHEKKQYIDFLKQNEILEEFGTSQMIDIVGFISCKYCGEEIGLLDNKESIEVYIENQKGTTVSTDDYPVNNFYEICEFVSFAMSLTKYNERYTQELLRDAVKILVFNKSNELTGELTERKFAEELKYWTLLYSVGIIEYLISKNMLKLKLSTIKLTKNRIKYLIKLIVDNNNDIIHKSFDRLTEDFENTISVISNNTTVTDLLTSERIEIKPPINIVSIIIDDIKKILNNRLIKNNVDLSNVINPSNSKNKPFWEATKMLIANIPGEFPGNLPIYDFNYNYNYLLKTISNGIKNFMHLPSLTPMQKIEKAEYMEPAINPFIDTIDGTKRKIERIILNGRDMSYSKWKQLLKKYVKHGQQGVPYYGPISFKELYSGEIQIFTNDNINIIETELSETQQEYLIQSKIKERMTEWYDHFKPYYESFNTTDKIEKVYENFIDYLPKTQIFTNNTTVEFNHHILPIPDEIDPDRKTEITNIIQKMAGIDVINLSISISTLDDSYDNVTYLKALIDSTTIIIALHKHIDKLKHNYVYIADSIYNSLLSEEDKKIKILSLLLHIMDDVYKYVDVFSDVIELFINTYMYMFNARLELYVTLQERINYRLHNEFMKYYNMSHIEKMKRGLNKDSFNTMLIDMLNNELNIDESKVQLAPEYDDSMELPEPPKD